MLLSKKVLTLRSTMMCRRETVYGATNRVYLRQNEIYNIYY